MQIENKCVCVCVRVVGFFFVFVFLNFRYDESADVFLNCMVACKSLSTAGQYDLLWLVNKQLPYFQKANNG